MTLSAHVLFTDNAAAAVVPVSAMNNPIFDRVDFELVTILKSAMKSNVPPEVQLPKVWPVAGSLTLVTSAILTSFAVQFSKLEEAVLVGETPCEMLYSFCMQLRAGVACANS
jgi:hypothetical protein